MNNQRQFDRQQQLRKVAILVASLDDRSAQPLLSSLSPRDADAVRRTVDQLSEIDSAEQQAILGDFRRSMVDQVSEAGETLPFGSADGVELDASLLARIEAAETGDTYANPSLGLSTQTMLAEADAATLADLLSSEHPQTIAMVISRLDRPRASDVLGRLSTALQVEVLARLADLDAADAQTMQVVESQLAESITDDRQRQQRMAAGVALVEQLLDATPDGRRQTILTSLTTRIPSLAGRLHQPAETKRPAARADRLKTPPRRKTAARFLTPRAQPPPAMTESVDLAGELERVDDATLLAALSQTNQHVVMLALAGADEQVLKRILRRLPRRQAKAFRRQLRAVGPTRLGDMLAAQQKLARTVRQLA